MTNPNDITIEQNIPLPDTGWRGAALPNYPKSSEYPWSRMKPKDSFFIPLPEGGDIVRLMNRITGSAAGKLGAGKISARCVQEGGFIGVRAWRLEDEE